MTVVPVESRRPAARHARPRTKKDRASVSKPIPKPVNAAIDWISPRRVPLAVYAAWITIFASGVFAQVSGALLAGGAGLMVGVLVGFGVRTASEVHVREELRRLRAENAGLRTKAVPPVDTSATTETTVLPRIRGER